MSSVMEDIGGRVWRLSSAAMLVLVVSLMAVSSAAASTTVGQLFTPTYEGGKEGCAAGTFLQTGVSSGSSYTIPTSGTVTSWSFQTNKLVVPGLQLKIAQPLGENKYKIVGESTAGTQVADAVNTFTASIPVKAGDVIGIYENGGGCYSDTTFEQDSYAWVQNEDEMAGGTETYEPLDEGRIPLTVSVVAAPVSTLVVPACSQSGALSGTVSVDPTTSANALRYKLDGGAEQVVSTGSGGSVSISVPAGSHTLEYWSEDRLPQQESQHHTVSVVVDSTPPTVSITSDQHASSYLAGQPGSVTTIAADAGSGLAVNPAGSGQVIATAHAGSFVVTRSATDKCGNVASASFAYKVAPVDSKPTLSRKAFLAPSRGTVITYVASDAGKTAFTVFKAVTGRKRGASCVMPKNGAAHGKRCTLFVKVRGGLVHTDKAGKNTIHFTGRLSGHTLPAGTYRLSLTPTAAGIKGPTVNGAFQITP